MIPSISIRYRTVSLLRMLATLVLCCGLSLSLLAQEGPEAWPKKKIGKKWFYVHIVEPGNTWYGISKKYSVSVNDLQEANPELGDVLSINHTILVPVKKVQKKEAKDNPPDLDGAYMLHTVQAKETLYALSRKFKVSVQDIVESNEALGEGGSGLQAGAQIRIPTGKVTAVEDTTHIQAAIPDTLPGHRVRKGDTEYAIAKQYSVSIDSLRLVNKDFPIGLQEGMMVRIPRARRKAKAVLEEEPEYYTSPEGITYGKDTGRFRPVYNVAVMVPMYLDTNELLEEDRDPEDLETIYRESMEALHFYEGVLLAVDSLRRQGLEVRLHAYDTYGDTAHVRQLLQRHPEMAYMDLFIGPFFRANVMQVAAFARERQIPIVCPVSVKNMVLLGNEHVSEVVTSELTQLVGLSDYLIRNHRDKHILAVRSFSGKDPELFNYFITRAGQLTTKADSLNGDTLIRVDMSKVDANRIKWRLSKDKENIIVLPSRHHSYVSEFLTRVSYLARKNSDYRITVYGLESWMDFESIDILYFHRLNVHLTASGFIDWQQPATRDFLRKYRAQYLTDPGPDGLGVRGFDVAYFFLSALKEGGVDFQRTLPEREATGLGTNFDFYKTSLESGHENKNFFLLRYEDYQLKRVQ
ncbi:MAG: LysM peptidoglycan-binding domain-containing protein [Bacteroidota bacterium]